VVWVFPGQLPLDWFVDGPLGARIKKEGLRQEDALVAVKTQVAWGCRQFPAECVTDFELPTFAGAFGVSERAQCRTEILRYPKESSAARWGLR